MLLAGCASFAIYYGVVVGIPLLSSGDEIRHAARQRTYGIGLVFQWFQGFSILAACLCVATRNRQFRRLNAILAFAGFVLTVLTGYRWIALLYLLTPSVTSHYCRHSLRLNAKSIKRYVWAGALAIVLLSGVGYLRIADDEAHFLTGIELMRVPVRLKYVAPFFLSLQTPVASYSQLINDVPDLFPYLGGRYSLVQIPGAALLSSAASQENTVVYVTNEIFGFDYRRGAGATALSILGNFYIDAGLAYVVIGMIALGFALDRAHTLLFEAGSLFPIVAYAFLLCTSLKWIVAGVYIGDLSLLFFLWISWRYVSFTNSPSATTRNSCDRNQATNQRQRARP
jgi:hypothetical protein